MLGAPPEFLFPFVRDGAQESLALPSSGLGTLRESLFWGSVLSPEYILRDITSVGPG